jgi:exonuclease VII small subunit
MQKQIVDRNSIAMTVNAAFHGGTEEAFDSSIAELEYGVEKLETFHRGADLSREEAIKTIALLETAIDALKHARQALEILATRYS